MIGVQTPRRVLVAATVVAVTVAFAGRASAQPGTPSVTVNSDMSITLSYSSPTPVPPTGAWVAATFNGAPIPGSPFYIGAATAVRSGPLPFGTYSVQVLWDAVTASGVTTFALPGNVGTPFMRGVAVDKDTVMLAWDPASGGVQYYEIEATVVGTGQVVTVNVGNVTGLTARNVVPDTYSVRVRAVNANGPGAFSNAQAFRVGVDTTPGDLQVSLTWNSGSDMDLHVIEPDGTHVFHGNLVGRSARLDFDDRDGFGPENIVVPPAFVMPGIYRIYVVHNGGAAETTSTIAITTGSLTPTPKTVLINRRTRVPNSGNAVLVAAINIRTGEIVELQGTTPQ